MIKWNDNFTMQRDVNGETIIIGQQDFADNLILVKKGDGGIIGCPMRTDQNGDIYFVYNGMGVYVSEHLSNFQIKEE